MFKLTKLREPTEGGKGWGKEAEQRTETWTISTLQANQILKKNQQ
jgi:hypothetical protein